MSKKHKYYSSGYSEAGASTQKRALKGFTARSYSPADDINRNNKTLRQRARMLYMAAPLATSAINTNRTKVVGNGLEFRAMPDTNILGITPEEAVEWQKKTEAEFALWAQDRRSCDALALNDFASIQQLVIKSWLLSGDVFVLLQRDEATPYNPYSLRLHVVEADRVCTPYKFFAAGSNPHDVADCTIPQGLPGGGNRVYDGVEVDKRGRVVAYYVANGYPTQYLTETMEWQRVEAFGKTTGMPNVLHVMEAERPDQYRGVPYLAQVIEPLLQLRRYTESELMAALVQSFFTAWVKTQADQTEIPFNEVGGGDIAGVQSQTDFGENISESANEYEMAPGTVTHLAEGEDIVFGNPNIPTAGFGAFTKVIAQMVGAALELPYDVLTKEFNSSYSASRGALLEAWEAFRMRRQWLVNDFCQPVYEAWLAEAVALGRIKAPGFFTDPLIRKAWCGARWIGAAQGQLDPNKEANAAMTLIGAGIKTHEQVAREMGGGDWDENVRKLAYENSVLSDALKPLVGMTTETAADIPDEEVVAEETEDVGNGK